MKPIFALTLILAAVSMLNAAPEAAKKGTGGLGNDAPAGKRTTYKESAGKPRQMEIYFPPNHDPSKAKVPGLLLFHGGAWSGGTLDQFRVACAYFASRGLVCATAEYQMLSAADANQLPAGETRKRVCVTDARSAIRWFKQHAPELGIDPNRIITGGGSAGGHISALATLNPGLNDPADPKDIDTSAVAYLWFNPAFALNDDKDAEIDILRYAKPGLAPAIVFFGDQDSWKKGWDIAHAKWQSCGVQTIDLQIAPGQSHSFFNKDPWQTLTLIAADRFLVKHGLLTGQPTKPTPASGEQLKAVLGGPVPSQNPAASTPYVKNGSLKAYKLVWSDEFNNSELNAEKWNYRTDSRMWSTQKPENVKLSGGKLKLNLKKEEAGGMHYTGGGVISKQAFRYGYYEASMKTPPGAGWHTSFWMMQHNSKSKTGPTATCQELDVIENDSIHKQSYGVNVHKWTGGHLAFGGKNVKTPDLSANFHIFGCEFTPTTVNYFFDGALVQSVNVTKAMKKEGTAVKFEHGDQNIWLTSIASKLGGTKAVDDLALPAVAEFDYVRFFSAKP